VPTIAPAIGAAVDLYGPLESDNNTVNAVIRDCRCVRLV
jgi:hypothetical protein